MSPLFGDTHPCRAVVVDAWGPGKAVDDTACYGGASATLCLHFTGETVDRIVVRPVNLKTLVRGLARDGY